MATELTTLVQRCRTGDELAWEALVRRFQGRVYALACHYVGNREEARDLAQDIFIRIYRAMPRLQKDDSFVSWMLQVARTAALDHLRRRKVRPPAQDVPVEDMYDLRDPAVDPHARLEAQAQKNLVHRAMQALSEIHREILQLKDIQGLSLEEVGRILDIPLGTVKSRSRRARLELAGQVMSLQEAAGESHGPEVR